MSFRALPLMLSVFLSACAAKSTDDAVESSAAEGGELDGSDGDNDSDDDGASWTLEPGVQTFTIDEEIDGQVVAREIIVHVPADANGPLPALFAFHGAGGEPNQWVSGLGALVDEEELII